LVTSHGDSGHLPAPLELSIVFVIRAFVWTLRIFTDQSKLSCPFFKNCYGVSHHFVIERLIEAHDSVQGSRVYYQFERRGVFKLEDKLFTSDSKNWWLVSLFTLQEGFCLCALGSLPADVSSTNSLR